MQSLLLLLVQIILISIEANADWFCNDSAGRNTQDSYQVCGIGESSTESQARALAFEAAKAEFARTCSEIESCKTRNKHLELKRTECKKVESGIIRCYRMLEYTLADSNPASAASAEIIEKQLEEKKKQLIELRKRAIELEQLKIADKQIEYEKLKIANLEGNNSTDLQKNIDKMAVELENDSNRANFIKPVRSPVWVYKISISYSGSTLKNQSYDLASYRFELERRFTDLFGINLSIDPSATGKNTSKENFTSTLLAVGIPIYVFQQFSIRPEMLQRTTKYSPISASEEIIHQSGYGLSIQYHSFELTESWAAGLSLGIGIHNYSGSTESTSAVSSSVGLAIAY